MHISQAAARSGLPAKTIRYYEQIGLVVPPRRANGYRAYGPREVDLLTFIHRARDLGFDIGTCRKLLALYEDRERASADVKSLAREHLAEIERKMVELRAMSATLTRLIENCRGDTRPDCPIIADLAGNGPIPRHCKEDAGCEISPARR